MTAKYNFRVCSIRLVGSRAEHACQASAWLAALKMLWNVR